MMDARRTIPFNMVLQQLCILTHYKKEHVHYPGTQWAAGRISGLMNLQITPVFHKFIIYIIVSICNSTYLVSIILIYILCHISYVYRAYLWRHPPWRV